MADKRMFSKKIIDSDAFLDMPQSTQLLYFHLSMRADDDGFINNPKAIMRNAKCNEDDFKVLISKKFIIPFESGVVVIKHWKIHNYIAKDRYKETTYKEEKSMLILDENNAYSVPYTECIQPVYKMDTQDRLDKDRLDKNIYMITSSQIDKEFNELWAIYPTGRKQGKKKAFENYKKARKTGTTFEEVKKGIEDYKKYILINKIQRQYIKQASSFFNQHAWQDEWISADVAPDKELDEIL